MTPKESTPDASIPPFSLAFPAKPLHTPFDWNNLVVPESTAQQLDGLRLWLQHGQILREEWGLGKKGEQGYITLFYGPPGTGKTMAASLLGKVANRDVYRIDLSLLLSKYIGETEKNLERLFGKAEDKHWILFFDEADSLFGKRTVIGDAHDRYANQTVSYLLQRLEAYPGLVIFSFHQTIPIDEAFLHRFRSLVPFPLPAPAERLRLWEQAFSPASEPPKKEELMRLALNYELTGCAIVNIVQYASLKAIARQEKTIAMEDLLQGIRQELNGRSLTT